MLLNNTPNWFHAVRYQKCSSLCTRHVCRSTTNTYCKSRRGKRNDFYSFRFPYVLRLNCKYSQRTSFCFLSLHCYKNMFCTSKTVLNAANEFVKFFSFRTRNIYLFFFFPPSRKRKRSNHWSTTFFFPPRR